MTGGAPRVGIGLDVHRLVPGSGPLRLCGVDLRVPYVLEGTSDADAAIHAVIDGFLGASALGDIGLLFPSEDPQWQGADSAVLARAALRALGEAGFQVHNVDLTIVSGVVRVAPHREEMRAALAHVLGVDVGAVSVKATTTDGLGFVGRDQGLAALAVVSVLAAHPQP